MDQNLSMTRGDTGSFNLQFVNYDGDLENDMQSMIFTVKENVDSGTAVFQKTLGSGISKVNDGLDVVRIAPADTEDLALGYYYYDLEIRINGDAFTVLKGVIEITYDVTTTEQTVIIAPYEELEDIRVGYDGTLYNTAGEAVRGQISDLHDEVDVLDGRMDEFASLPAGSTAGDAELADIRVGADGTTYPTAGDAVRGQVEELDDKIGNNTDAIGDIDSDVDVLKARMDVFASLEDGSTTGDAELQDIRVGANGITYPTAGDAVRGQISDLNENYRQSIMEYFPTWETGGINDDGTDNDSQTTYKRTDFIPVEILMGMPIVNANATYNAYLYEYSDDDVSDFVKYTQLNKNYTTIFEPNKNTKYVRLRWTPSIADDVIYYTNTPVYALAKENASEIKKVEFKTNVINFSPNLLDKNSNKQNNAYIKSDGTIASSNGWVAFTDYIPVEPNTKYMAVYWNGSAWSKATSGYYSFYDSEKNATHGAIVSSAYPAEAGENDAYIRISFANAIANAYPMLGTLSFIDSLSNSLSEYVDGAVTEITNDKALKRLGSAIDHTVLLPSECYAVVDTEFNIYYENVFSVDNTENYFFGAFINTGIAYNLYSDRISITPTNAMIGDHSLILYAVRKNQTDYSKRVVTKTIVLHIMHNSTLSNKNVIFIGDSLTNAGYYPYEIQKILSNDGVVSLGTMVSHPWIDGTQKTINHEGRGGWSAYDYTEVASKGDDTNAFWNPNTSEFDFSYYMTQQGYSTPDIVFLNLGTNGVDQTEKIVNAIKDMITSIHAYDSNIPICVSLITPPATQDGWTYMLKNGTTAVEFEINQRKLNARYIEEFDGVISNVYVSPVYFNLDRYHDYDTAEFPVSARNPELVVRQTNNVHPSKYGYLKFADVYWEMIQMLLA